MLPRYKILEVFKTFHRLSHYSTDISSQENFTCKGNFWDPLKNISSMSKLSELAEVYFLYPGDLVSCKKADEDFFNFKKLDTFPFFVNLVGAGQMAKHILSSSLL